MREMKNSGIDFLGTIPKDWDLKRFKYVHTGSNTGMGISREYWTDSKDDRPFYTAQLNPINTNFKDFPKWKYTVSNDLLLSRNATPYVYIPKEGSVYTDHIIRVNINSDFNKRFIYYSLKNSINSEMADGVSLLTWSMPIWDRQRLPLPSFEEQQQIVDYLDAKCDKIDKAINHHKSVIEKLKEYRTAVITKAVTKGLNPNVEMKDSGIEWLGNIPNNWNVIKIKFLRNNEVDSFIDGDWIESPYIVDNGIKYFTTGNIGNGVFKRQNDSFISEETFKKLNCKYAYAGDLIFSRLNAPYGRSCILPNDIDKCVIAVDNVILRTDNDKRYICYVTQCLGYQKAIEHKTAGTTMNRISRSKLGNIKLPVPPKDIQHKIADYLDAKCDKIDTAVQHQEQAIAKLEEYRKSVIYYAVTGKIDCRKAV